MRAATVLNYLIEATLMGSAMILLLLPVRHFLRARLSSRVICFAWLLVAARLLIPLALPNPLMNELRPALSVNHGVRPIADQVRVRAMDALREASYSLEAQEGESAALLSGFLFDLYRDLSNGRMASRVLTVYAAGVLLAAGWMVWRNARFLRRLRQCRVGPLSGGDLEGYLKLCKQRRARPLPVYWVDPLPGACLVGVFRPYIALPLMVKKEDLPAVLAHEVCHQKARDPLWGLVRNACCALCWFNPLVWQAARLLRTDQEMACDERVIRSLNHEERLRYASTLAHAADRGAPEASMLATGMTMKGRHLKRRVRAIVDGGRTVGWLCAAALCVACAGTVAAFATGESLRLLTEPKAPAWSTSVAAQRAVSTQEEAVAYAQGVLSSGPWDDATVDALGQVEWQTLYSEEADMWHVTSWPPAGSKNGLFELGFDGDGRVWEMADSIACADALQGGELSYANPSYDENGEYGEMIAGLVLRWSELVLGEAFSDITIQWDVWRGDQRYIQVSASSDEPAYNSGHFLIRMFPEMYVMRFERKKDGNVALIQAGNAAAQARQERRLLRALEYTQALSADFLSALEGEQATQAQRAYDCLTLTFGYSIADADRFLYAHMRNDGGDFLVFHDPACPAWNYVMSFFGDALSPFTSVQGAYAQEEGIRFLWYRVEEEGWFDRWQAHDRDDFVHNAIDYRYQIPFSEEQKASIRSGEVDVRQAIQAVFEAYYGPEGQWSEALCGWRDATLERFGQ